MTYNLIVTPVSLSMAMVGTNAIVSWLIGETAGLNPASWSTVGDSAQVVVANYQMTIPLSPGSQLFPTTKTIAERVEARCEANSKRQTNCEFHPQSPPGY